MKRRTTRRGFLEQSTKAAALTAAVSTLGGVHTEAAQKRENVNLALIGCGGIMNHHARGLAVARPGVTVTWLCDVDAGQIERISKTVDSMQSIRPARTSKFEEVLADKNTDAVIIATPHHWHAPIGVRAMESGKDVYCEKPISHVYGEGKEMISTLR